MQSFMQTWYLTCGRSRGQRTFLASAILVGHVLPFGRRSCQNAMLSSKLSSVHLCFAFISIAKCYIQAGIPVVASFVQLCNRVFLELRHLGFLSSCTSCVQRLFDKQLLNMRVPHPA